ncbi:MAG TPA: zinc-dependent metalloprotease family protein [Flavobacterium sp.]|nr:zinc-dependent metalloprotease family protein [Flavobacterium sp.]
MKKNLLLIVLAIFAFSSDSYSQSLWSKVSQDRLSLLEKVDRSSMPKDFQLYQLDFDALKAKLETAPSRESGIVSALVIPFPNAEGKLQNYAVYESSVLEPALAATHPELKSYVGKGIDDATATIHFSVTIFGLHTMTRSGNGTFYIDPYTKNLQNYIVYNKSSLTRTRQFRCQAEDNSLEGRSNDADFSNVTFANDGKLRTYRLAMTCTVEYAAFHVNAAGVSGGTLAQKKAAVLAAMGVTVTRLNSVYEIDMSLRMILVANNENAIFIDSDNFTNDPPTMINEIQPIMDAAIGSANYDIGHGSCTSDNGIAQLQSVCGANKSRGVTGQLNPVGDAFDIDYVAHEIGHQFGATHTQNNNCNRSAATAVEPGSASTIMGYAGICAPDVQANSDAYFHTVSLSQMFAFVNGAGNCSVNTSNGNNAPVVAALASYTIPKGTAFVLRGSATDANGDALTYCWEQTTAGATTAVPSATSADANPNFRSVSPTVSPNRYFPALPTVLSGSLASTWEVIPNVARVMTFALTVRDNRTPNGGQTGRQNMSVTFDGTAGPFKVTSQAADGISWNQNSTQTITWDVAGTTAAPISTANVKILLSTDGGLTFPTVLAASTPNDGSESITVPNIAAPFCRIMVEAVDNIYFAVNAKPFAIGYILTPVCTVFSNTTVSAIPDGPSATVSTAGPTLTSTINIPATQTITDVNVTVNVSHQWIRDLTSKLKHPDGTEVMLGNRICNDQDGYNIVFNDGSPAIVCATPITSGTFAPNQPLSVLNGKPSAGNWQLLINDFFLGDTGNLNSWSVEVCYNIPTLSTPNFGLADFKIYPNPNSGNFNVEFDSNSGNEIKIAVNDIRGRQIFSKSYQNTGLFSQNLQLSNVEAGIYIVTVQDGDRKETKKIVIE